MQKLCSHNIVVPFIHFTIKNFDSCQFFFFLLPSVFPLPPLFVSLFILIFIFFCDVFKITVKIPLVFVIFQFFFHGFGTCLFLLQAFIYLTLFFYIYKYMNLYIKKIHQISFPPSQKKGLCKCSVYVSKPQTLPTTAWRRRCAGIVEVRTNWLLSCIPIRFPICSLFILEKKAL